MSSSWLNGLVPQRSHSHTSALDIHTCNREWKTLAGRCVDEQTTLHIPLCSQRKQPWAEVGINPSSLHHWSPVSVQVVWSQCVYKKVDFETPFKRMDWLEGVLSLCTCGASLGPWVKRSMGSIFTRRHRAASSLEDGFPVVLRQQLWRCRRGRKFLRRGPTIGTPALQTPTLSRKTPWTMNSLLLLFCILLIL